MSTLRFLRTFVAVAQYGSFAAAAEHMALTQSAVSMQMRALEDGFKHELFDRYGRTVTLNSTGKNLLPLAQQLLSIYEGMQTLAGTLEEQAGSVTIGTVESAVSALAQAVAKIKMAQPRLNVRVMTAKSNELAARVDAGDIDAAVLVDAPGRRLASMKWTPLYSEPLVLLANPNMLPASIAELFASQRFLRFDRAQRTGVIIDRVLRKQRFTVNEFLELGSLEGIAELVRKGMGVAVVPWPRHSSWVLDDNLRALPLAGIDDTRRVGILERAQHDKMAVTGIIAQQIME